jgi:hypothetical protein
MTRSGRCRAGRLLAVAAALWLAGPAGSPAPARGGVPSSCIHPQADPIRCPRDTRLVTERVMPAARLRALRRQRPELERVAPREDRQRNRTLEQIREELPCPGC